MKLYYSKVKRKNMRICRNEVLQLTKVNIKRQEKKLRHGIASTLLA